MSVQPEQATKRGGWLRIVLAVVSLALCAVITAFAYLPVPEDAVLPLSEQGGGARQNDGSTTGLQLTWETLATVDEPRAELGRLLFYDPVLSANNDMSCATCHHPDMGFSDGLTVSLGSHGEDLRRNSPSLWNIAYADSLFWDGRASSLEEQMLIPLTSSEEMGADVADLVAELQTIPEYVSSFTTNFEDGITVDNVITAIAEFERTLITNNSAFDRFAAGDFNALTPQQRRGFDVFRSAQTRCFECHAWPTFTHNTFHVLGVPDRDPEAPDLGRVEVQNAADATRAFRTPPLRNVALNAPYMHNGAFDTLEEVVQFYEDGGGRPDGIEGIDEKIRGFEITDQQAADLVAFLYALTDEPTALITIPESVPSGLPVVQAQENLARVLVEQSIAEPFNPETRPSETITVQSGESIQTAIDRALPGDIILVEAGTYRESVYIDTPNLTVRGIVDGDNRPWLDGENSRSDGFNTTGDDFVLEGFGFRGYIGNAVLTTGAERVVFRDLIIEGTYGDTERDTIYGLYPVECTDILIENVTVSGIGDAGIYVGQSRGPIIVRNSIAFGNVTGIEIENSTDADVHDNHVYGNTGGILVFLLPNNPSKVGYNTRVYNNLIEDNNLPNFAAEGATVAFVPAGTGILIMSADNTEVYNNTIRNNQSFGVGLSSLYMIYDRDTVFDLGPIPENNRIYDNIWENNGYAPSGLVASLGLPGADILWTGDGWNNVFDEPNATKFPPLLPTSDMPAPLQRALWRTYDIVIGILLG